jgi:hypothetical protein
MKFVIMCREKIAGVIGYVETSKSNVALGNCSFFIGHIKRSKCCGHSQTRDKKIEFKLGETNALLNGKKQVNLVAPARKVNGAIMVPLRFVAEAFDVPFSWDAKAKTARIFTTLFQQFVYTQNNDGSSTSYIKNLADIPENLPPGKELVHFLVYQKPWTNTMYYSELTSIVDTNKNDGSKEQLRVVSQGNLGNDNKWTGNYDIYSTAPDTGKENYHKSGSIAAEAKEATNAKVNYRTKKEFLLHGETIERMSKLKPYDYDYEYFPLTISQALKNSSFVTK